MFRVQYSQVRSPWKFLLHRNSYFNWCGSYFPFLPHFLWSRRLSYRYLCYAKISSPMLFFASHHWFCHRCTSTSQPSTVSNSGRLRNTTRPTTDGGGPTWSSSPSLPSSFSAGCHSIFSISPPNSIRLAYSAHFSGLFLQHILIKISTVSRWRLFSNSE